MQTEDLQKALKETVLKQEEEHREKAALLAKQKEKAKAAAEEERNRRIKAQQEAEDKAKQRKLAEQKAEQERLKAERDAQMELERKQNEAAEEMRKQQEEATAIEKALAQAQFMEEQNKKALEELAAASVEISETAKLATKPGDPVEGIHGNTPETPLMSQHLRELLRQDSRNY